MAVVLCCNNYPQKRTLQTRVQELGWKPRRLDAASMEHTQVLIRTIQSTKAEEIYLRHQKFFDLQNLTVSCTLYPSIRPIHSLKPPIFFNTQSPTPSRSLQSSTGRQLFTRGLPGVISRDKVSQHNDRAACFRSAVVAVKYRTMH